MPSRYELTEAQWNRIQDLQPGRKETVGRTAADNRRFVNGVLWILLPGRDGKICRSAMASTRVCTNDSYAGRAAECGSAFLPLWCRIDTTGTGCLDSTIVKAHQQAATGRKKGGCDQALGRTRGGLTRKIHLLCNQLGEPVDFRLTAGQVHDSTQAPAPLGQRRAEAVIADKGYDADAIVRHIEAHGARAVIPPKRNRRVQRKFSKALYRQRNRIERTFAQLKHFVVWRLVTTRR